MDKKYEIIAATIVVIMVLVVGVLGLTFKAQFTRSASPLHPPALTQVRSIL